MSHAFRQLFESCRAESTRPYIGRGSHRLRCTACRLPPARCICEHRPTPSTKAEFIFLLYQGEIFKPSNTGWLVADVVSQCHAFVWSRTHPDEAFLSLLAEPGYQPVVVFPAQYAHGDQRVIHASSELPEGVKPRYIMLDGSWREACKMFRKSPYLAQLPMLSFQPEAFSRFQLRTAVHRHQLATAEVAALVLEQGGEVDAAQTLDQWFDCYSMASLSEARRQRQQSASTS